MGQYSDSEPTHALPQELVNKLVEAKEWYDQYIPARMDDEEWSLSDRRARALLEEIVEIIDGTWGWARELPGKADQ